MITYKKGDLLKEGAEAIVNTVNCVGVMGRGIALQFKKAHPENFKRYAAACKKKEVQPGKMLVVETGCFSNPKFIINFPTKRHWRGKSQIADIEMGLRALAEEISKRNIHSIAIPPLGSGLGGLPWPEVRSRIVDALGGLKGLHVVIFEPSSAAASERGHRDSIVPKMTCGRAALLELMHRYLGGLLDPSISLLELHKLMYFMQIAGEPLRLNYVEADYGPYADNLRHVLNAIEGHFVSGYADGGDAPDKQLELAPGALDAAQTFLRDQADTQRNLERVSELVDGFESPFGLELLSSVHWIFHKESALAPSDLVSKLHGWNDRKKQFTERQVKLAFDVLLHKGWMDGKKPA